MTSSGIVGIVGIILAGGASSRFGADKLAADLEGRPLLHHALDAVAEVAGRVVLVIAPAAAVPSIPAGLASRVTIARDDVALGGPLAGLAAGIAAVATPSRDEAPRIIGADAWRGRGRGRAGAGAGIVLVVGGDMPWLQPAVLRLLADTLAADRSLVAMTLAASETAPLPIALRSEPARMAMAACLAGGRRSLRALLDNVPSATLSATAWRALDPAGDTLRDVDSPGDLPRR